MAKTSNKKLVKSRKLYHGTTASIAKTACSYKGLVPYEIESLCGVSQNIRASTLKNICLTEFYPAFMAFDASYGKDKWGIIEIDVSNLCPEQLLPHEGYLIDKDKSNFISEESRLKKMNQLREECIVHKRKWKDSLNDFGFCLYSDIIPISAITRVAIYDPYSNPIITKAASNVFLGEKFHKSNQNRQSLLVKWILGEYVDPSEWFGKDEYLKLPYSEKAIISQHIMNKSGLDIFYYSDKDNSKKISWW